MGESFFSKLEIDEGAVRCKRYKKGEVVSDRPDGVECVGLVHSGSVYSRLATEAGNEVLVSVLRPGAVFGVSNLFLPSPLGTVLVCRENSEIRYVKKSLIVERVKRDGKGLLVYTELCNDRIQFLLRRIADLQNGSARVKLAIYLSDENRMDYGSMDALASALAVSRSALYRETAFLTKEGIIGYENGKVSVLDMAALEKILD
jgi:cAMP-binding proteins - catabolite gene activator and regulatory subunit of cAMP-dependent protein kinases